jgi:hypothetical protein
MCVLFTGLDITLLENRGNRGNIDNPNTHMHYHELSWLGAGTYIKDIVGVRIVSSEQSMYFKKNGRDKLVSSEHT